MIYFEAATCRVEDFVDTIDHPWWSDDDTIAVRNRVEDSLVAIIENEIEKHVERRLEEHYREEVHHETMSQ